MSNKLKQKELEDLNEFIKLHQKLAGGAMVMEMLHFEADETTVHTEIENPEVVKGKYLVTTTVRPLTEELKESIVNPKKK